MVGISSARRMMATLLRERLSRSASTRSGVPPQLRSGRRVLPGLAIVSAARSPPAVATGAAEPDPAALLQANGIAPTPAAVGTYLRGWIVDDALKARIDQLIADLGDDEFERRQNATEELARIGP